VRERLAEGVGIIHDEGDALRPVRQVRPSEGRGEVVALAGVFARDRFAGGEREERKAEVVRRSAVCRSVGESMTDRVPNTGRRARCSGS
jgi:hypothetical protein